MIKNSNSKAHVTGEMEAKVKEEIPDKDYTAPNTTERRKYVTNIGSHAATIRRANVTNIGSHAATIRRATTLSSTESLSPPLDGRGSAPALQRLRKFLSALHQFAGDISGDTGERVRQLIFNLVAGTVNIEEFQVGVQECTNYPLRASVPGFLRALLPLTPVQYMRAHEHLILEAAGDADIFHQHNTAEPEGLLPLGKNAKNPDNKCRFYDAATNGGQEEYPPAKRASLLNPSPFYSLPSNASLFDYHPYHPYHTPHEPPFERRDDITNPRIIRYQSESNQPISYKLLSSSFSIRKLRQYINSSNPGITLTHSITVRDVSSMNASFTEPRGGVVKTDDEWKNIHTMLNCTLSMVEKTKRALTILQNRSTGVEQAENNDIKRAASEIIAAAVRQTEERVGEVKRQALLELQRAVGAAECKALELVTERRRLSPPPCRELSPTQQTVCSGRDLKPTAMLRSSPPATTTLAKTLPRSTTPIATQPNSTTLPDSRLPITTMSTDRLHQDRNLPSNDRVALSTLSTAQSLTSGIGGKK
ncbi:unnamed protein product [Leptidea sinapis]|uniref:TAFH domain-containing protein n=1 Tax=Leptidea sinapis TaxID=189913 RepID=A0A5E4QH59_9NEOP|nr:unnamed protein product [Leptidea sinapis]